MHWIIEDNVAGQMSRSLVRSGDLLVDEASSSSTCELSIGCVVAITSADHDKLQFVFARKAAKPVTDLYIFGGQWVLPGGMVRSNRQAEFDALQMIVTSACTRVQAETGISLPIESLRPVQHVPPVTTYRARGQDRVVIVVPLECVVALNMPSELQSGDSSIDKVELAEPRDRISTCAPANRVIVARMVWKSLSAADRDLLSPCVTAAIEECNNLASRHGFPLIPLLHSWN